MARPLSRGVGVDDGDPDVGEDEVPAKAARCESPSEGDGFALAHQEWLIDDGIEAEAEYRGT